MSTLPRMISFLLPGRITLSEHLPAEVNNVPTTLVRRSGYLHRMVVQHAATNPTDWQIRLSNIDSIGFGIYVNWLRSGPVEFSKIPMISKRKGSLLLCEVFDYIFAHIAGSQLEDPSFQDYTIDKMAWLLNASQTPDLQVLEVMFLEKGASNALKQFIVDRMFAVERRMLAVMRGLTDDREIGRHGDAECKYHVHEGRKCYRNDTNQGRVKTKKASEIEHQIFNTNNITGNNSQSTESSSSTSLDSNLPAKNAFYDMTNTKYFGSEEWSREMHGLGRRTPTIHLHIDKPLPTIPPLSSDTLLTLPHFLPISNHFVSDCPSYEAFSTEQLIHECLSRLPPDNASLIHQSDHTTDSHDPTIYSLALQCVERFQKSSSDSPLSYSSSPENSSPNHVLQPNAFTPFIDQGTTLTSHEESTCEERHAHWKKSFESLPKPWRKQFQTPLQAIGPQHEHSETPRHHLEALHHRHSHTSSPISNIVKRKPAPPRGNDWLKQRNRIDAMRKGEPVVVVVAKRNKKSKFKEMLRSESGIGMEGKGT
jgi:hypothetical protein